MAATSGPFSLDRRRAEADDRAGDSPIPGGPLLGWVIDTGWMDVIDARGQGLRPWTPHIEGTHSSEAILGSLTEGDGLLNGFEGNDVIYGTDRDELLIAETGNGVFVSGGGNDSIWAGDGNDIIDGGAGNDGLWGEEGSDTYIFRRGSGQDSVVDVDTAGEDAFNSYLADISEGLSIGKLGATFSHRVPQRVEGD